MNFKESKPVVRALEPIPVEHNGERVIFLRDPQNFSPNGLTISVQAFWIISMMDGVNSVEQIGANFNKAFKTNIPLDDMEKLVTALDDNLMLDNDKFEGHKKKVVENFLASPVRKPALAGTGYPADAVELSKMLDAYMDGASFPSSAPFALVAPHIDLRAGGQSFGAAYSQLRNSRAETFVILAIGHALSEDFFACTDKDFETPLGVSLLNRHFLAALESGFGEPLYSNSFAHRDEHSAELQLLFLQKLFGGENPSKRIVPILFSFPETIDEMNHPMFNPQRIGRFINALKKAVEEMGEKVCVIAGVDLSHVGQRFGQMDGVPKELLERVEKEDRRLLELIAEVDKKGFVEFMKEVNPKNHVCGFPALYVLLELLNGRKGKLLDYSQNVEGNNDSMVSFASMAYSGSLPE